MADTTTTSKDASTFKTTRILPFVHVVYYLVWLFVFGKALWMAFDIRTIALQEYGVVIHEFDPYFNYRATEYLWQHGWKPFREWFDYLVWYPLGRPVGTTIYPGMQVTSCLIKMFLLPHWTINDICCFVPTWFGVLATLGTALLCMECCNTTENDSILNHIPVLDKLYQNTLLPLQDMLVKLLAKLTGCTWNLKNSSNRYSPSFECGILTACVMSIVPAHLMRSVGGGYDNESVATTAMVFTFWCWVKSLSSEKGLVWGCATGVAYFYMVAAWGGYVFCLNLIGLHAALLVVLGRFSTKLHCAYSSFYLVGTVLAIQVPVVQWTPLKSLEQLGPLVVFGGMQILAYCHSIQEKRGLTWKQLWILRIQVSLFCLVVSSPLVYYLWTTGYFGPISARVRGLFVQHTRTGNPLVDSVAEHQAASAGAYYQYLDAVCFVAPVGFLLVALAFFNDASSFLLVYGGATYYFSHRMVRLILLTAPIGSALSGLALGRLWSYFIVSSVFGTNNVPNLTNVMKLIWTKQEESADEHKKDSKVATDQDETKTPPVDNIASRLIRFVVGVYLIFKFAIPKAMEFHTKSTTIAQHLSHPSIIQKATLRSGEQVMVDDYREAYFWLRDNTPPDARIMAWWDYGYQITAMANRTTIADGNTWNHEHIALLGRALTSPERDGHRIARHLADYVLLWCGGGGDDLAKSPHLARIANSVYRNMCPGDPTCRSFGLTQEGYPTPMMAASLLYRLHSHQLVHGVEADRNRFREVYKSKYGKVRIFKILSVSKESKAWVADPANRLCDAPGSWYCPGQYPPALQKILREKKDFRQLEDFNVDREHDVDYQQQYMENLNNPDNAKRQALENFKGTGGSKLQKLSQAEIDHLNQHWENNDMATLMWTLISKNDKRALRENLELSPALAHIRSGDGRGPMWWAHEYGRGEIVRFLKKLGVSETLQDANGITPLELTKSGGEL